MRLGISLLVLLLAAGSSAARAQDREAPPGRLEAVIEGPRVGHRPRYANVTAERRPDGRWALEGCHAAVRGSCRRTRRVLLDAGASRQLDALVEAVRRMPRCEPLAAPPAGPRFWFELDGQPYDGPVQEAAPEPGPCGAPGRLARSLAERLGR